ncbi:hypothetical protein RF094_08600, partial [Serratia marcescens]
PPTIEGGEPSAVEKPREEWTLEDRKKNNLDSIARDIFYKTVGKNVFHKIKACKTAKEIWDKIIQLNEGNKQTRE